MAKQKKVKLGKHGFEISSIGFLPAGTEWIIIVSLVFIIYFVIYKAIRNLFK